MATINDYNQSDTASEVRPHLSAINDYDHQRSQLRDIQR